MTCNANTKLISKYDTKEYRDELKFKAKLQKIEKRGERIIRKRELKEKAASYKEPKKKIQTSKIFFVLLFLSCTSTQIFSMVAMWHFADLSSLYALIGATLTEGVGILGYYLKSFNETKEEELIRLERDKLSGVFNNSLDPNDDSNNDYQSTPVG